MNLTADELRNTIPFKGEFLMYYKDGKNLFFKTSEFLYRVVEAKSGRVRLIIHKRYKTMKKAVMKCPIK